MSLTLARDARARFEKSHVLDSVTLRGRLTSAHRRSNRVGFFRLRDVSESIQVVVEREIVGDAVWEAFHSLQIGSSVAVTGHIRRSRNGVISLFPSEHPKQIGTDLDLESLLAEDFLGVASQLILARLENRVRSFFLTEEFVELSARYLSTTWGEDGLQPLRVSFAGQSRVPLYLAVSPIPKLITAFLAVGHSSLFAVSRSFATNFVATQNGAESVLVSAITVDRDLSACSRMVTQVASWLLAEPEPSPSSQHPNELLGACTYSTGQELTPGFVPEGLHIHHATSLFGQVGPGGNPVTEAFQLSWRRDFFLAEGMSLSLGRSLQINIVTVYIERFLRLLQASDNKRIRDLLHVSRPPG